MPDPYDCSDCGTVHQRGCRGHVDECTACGWRGGNNLGQPCSKCGELVARRPCGRWPRKGSNVCNAHGGRSPQAKAAAARRVAQAEALTTLADIEIQPIDDPLDTLAQIAAEAVAVKTHFANLVAELDKNMSFVNRQGDQKLDARVALYERALDRCQRFLADWVRLGFEERKAALDDARATLIRTIIVGIIVELGHQVDDKPVRQTLERWLPMLDGAPPPEITA